MIDYTTNIDAKDFFKRKVVLLSAIATAISVIGTYLISLLCGQSFSKSSQNIFLTLLFFDVFSAIYAFCMFLFYFRSKKGQDLNIPSRFLWITMFIQAALVFSFFAILFIGALTLKMKNELIYQIISFSCVLIEIYLLPQFIFSHSIRNLVKTGKRTYKGVGLAAFVNYFVAFAMFVPIFIYADSIWNIILIIITTLSYFFKGIVCSQYKKFVKKPYLTRSIFTPDSEHNRRLETKKR